MDFFRPQLFAALLLLLAPHAIHASRPNIVVLLTDDQTCYSLGCYGNPDVQTPNMDSLARDGIAFDNYYNTTAICMASRATIMTGLLEYRTGCNFEHGPLVREHWEKSYPIRLRKSGYLTAFAGKFGFVVAEAPGAKGVLPEDEFDRWGGGPGQTHYQTSKNESMGAYAERFPHSSRSYGAFGSDFIRDSAKSDHPFCLSISFKAPHKPATPDPLDDKIYEGKRFAKPANFGREYGDHFSAQSRVGRQFERFHSWNYSDDYDGVMATYHQQVYAVDVAVGMVRDAIRQAGVEDNTVIIFTSDNGFLCGSHGYGSKVLPYEEASRAPMIIFDPRHPNSGQQLRSSSLTGNVDVAPTVLELAGLSAPQELDGRSLLPIYNNPASEIHTHLPLINVWGPAPCHSLAIVTKDLKYIYWAYDRGEFDPSEELYDTANDPGELTNAAARHPDLEPMRLLYDQQLSHWASKAVPYHNYRPFAKKFARRKPVAK